MADGAKKGKNQSSGGELDLSRVDHDELQLAVAKLYGRGLKRAQVARLLVDYLSPTTRDRPIDQRTSSARTKLKRWEQSQKFRDLVYQHAIVGLDLELPGILQGLASRARRGRVDATRLALEITSRHNPKGDVAPTQVAVVFQGIPRPQGRTTEEHGEETRRQLEAGDEV